MSSLRSSLLPPLLLPHSGKSDYFFSSLSFFVLHVLFSKEEAAPFLTDWVSHGTKGPHPDPSQGPAVPRTSRVG